MREPTASSHPEIGSAAQLVGEVAHLRWEFARLEASFRRTRANLQSSHGPCLARDLATSAHLDSLGADFDALSHQVARLGDTAARLQGSARSQDDRPSPSPRSGERPTRRTILVVDDSLSARRMLCQPLEEAGHEVHQADDGRQALELIRALPNLDLLITDLDMPGLSGTDLCRHVRSHASYLPILVISAMTDDDTLVSSLDAGADAFIGKRDFNPRRFMSAVNRLLPD